MNSSLNYGPRASMLTQLLTVPDEQPDQASITQTAQKLGADSALVVRPIRVERKTEYGPSYLPVPWFGYFGPHFGASWYRGYGLPSGYNEYTSETTVYDMQKTKLFGPVRFEPSRPTISKPPSTPTYRPLPAL